MEKARVELCVRQERKEVGANFVEEMILDLRLKPKRQIIKWSVVKGTRVLQKEETPFVDKRHF